jgi:polyisoprenoid-binding protein YceI
MEHLNKINTLNMKNIFLILTVLFTVNLSSQIYMAKTGEISFYSEAKLENIDAKNSNAKPVMDTKSGKISVKVSMRAFKFKSGFMEEHFNENYIESDKYPHAIFEGKIRDNDKIDYSKDGEYNVICDGKMSLHGQTKEVNASGKLTIKGNTIFIDSKFKLALADYKIEIPAQRLANISETVDVTVKAELEPFKKQ